MQSCGLPHLSPEVRRESMDVVPAHPEVEESKGYIYEEGLVIGRERRGRGGLHERLQG